MEAVEALCHDCKEPLESSHFAAVPTEDGLKDLCPECHKVRYPATGRRPTPEFAPGNDACTHCHHCNRTLEDHIGPNYICPRKKNRR